MTYWRKWFNLFYNYLRCPSELLSLSLQPCSERVSGFGNRDILNNGYHWGSEISHFSHWVWATCNEVLHRIEDYILSMDFTLSLSGCGLFGFGCFVDGDLVLNLYILLTKAHKLVLSFLVDSFKKEWCLTPLTTNLVNCAASNRALVLPGTHREETLHLSLWDLQVGAWNPMIIGRQI